MRAALCASVTAKSRGRGGGGWQEAGGSMSSLRVGVAAPGIIPDAAAAAAPA